MSVSDFTLDVEVAPIFAKAQATVARLIADLELAKAAGSPVNEAAIRRADDPMNHFRRMLIELAQVHVSEWAGRDETHVQAGSDGVPTAAQVVLHDATPEAIAALVEAHSAAAIY